MGTHLQMYELFGHFLIFVFFDYYVVTGLITFWNSQQLETFTKTLSLE